MKVLLMRLDANCTIRNSDFKKYSGSNAIQQAGKLADQRLRVDGQDYYWEGKAKSSAMGVIANYEQRIKEIEQGPRCTGKESPRQLRERLFSCNGSYTRVPSAPSHRRTLSHNLSLLSL